MGKKLIIKGADFSENCIEKEIIWYSDYATQQLSPNEPNIYSTAGPQNLWVGAGRIDENVANKQVNIIRTKFNTDDPLGNDVVADNKYAIFKVSATDLNETATIELVKEFSITAEDIASGTKTILLDESIMMVSYSSILMIGYNGITDNSTNKRILPVATCNSTFNLSVSLNSGKLIQSSVVKSCIDYGYIEE